MRVGLIAFAVMLGLVADARAASPDLFGDLFGTRHVVRHHKHLARPAPGPTAAPKPQPSAPKPLPPTTAQKPSIAPQTSPTGDATGNVIPLPRPRPADAGSTPSVDQAPPAEAKSAPAASDSAEPTETTAPGPQSTTPAPASSASTTTTAPAEQRIYQTACPAIMSGLVAGKLLPPIHDGMCVAQSPFSVSDLLVNGRTVPLTTAATTTCGLATALPAWVSDVDAYLVGTEKTRIKSVTLGGSFECRDRNVEGGSSDLSEHGRADAVDITGFTLEDGRTLSVSTDYASTDPKTNRLMHYAHDAACSHFTTVLGPDANALHHDHFHLDLSCHGQSCSYRICE